MATCASAAAGGRLRSLRAPGWPGAPRRWAWLSGAIGAVVAIMLAHYLTDTHDVALHNIYRRLAYLPIVLAAFTHGVRGGLLTALAACLAYAPHAFFATHHDPSPSVDKAFEMVLYVVMGGLVGYLVNRRDQARAALERSLHERDALERQLVRADKMSALGQMTAGLAHEIRNPLASILGSAEAVVAELPKDHRKYEIGQLLLAEIDRLNRVVHDFVRFGRPNPPERKRVDLVDLGRQMTALAQAEARKRGLTLEVEPHGPIEVEADPDQISQVVLNLLLNACQAADGAQGAGAGRVQVRFEERELAGRTYLGAGVRDQGPGIPESLREEIFNPYFSTRPDGVGLGLSVSHRIIEAHGGFMDVETGRPTTVWLFLPQRSASP
jgi:two-component system, NtrC family, sensor histidine kinase HydH